MRKTICIILVCLSALSLLAVASYGITASGTAGPYTTTTPIPSTKTDWTGSLSFPKFNPALGALYRVDLSITGQIQTTLTVTNNSPTASSGDAKTHVEVTVTDPLALLTVMPDIYSSAYNYSLGAGQNSTSGLLTKSDTQTGSWTSADILTEFTGPGTIILPATTFTETWLTNTGGNTFASQVTNASATGTVTYYYSTPEPSSIMALLAGVSGLIGVASRRRRS